MIGTSRGELALVLLCVVWFRYTLLLYAVLVAAISLRCSQAQWYRGAAGGLCALLAAEALFYALVHVPHARRLGLVATQPAPLSRSVRRALFDRCMANVPDPESYLRWWFLGADVGDIRRENLRQFLFWAFFDMVEEDVRASADGEAISAELDEYVALVERRLGRPLHPGRGTARCLRLTLDSVGTAYRSLAWYAVVVDQATYAAMLWHGFELHARSPAATLDTFPWGPRGQESHRLLGGQGPDCRRGCGGSVPAAGAGRRQRRAAAS